MNGRSTRADFFDASALAKVYADEEYSEIVRRYFNNRSTKYTTPFCFYETLTVLKSKLRSKPPLLTRGVPRCLIAPGGVVSYVIRQGRRHQLHGPRSVR
jgi:hypothetical protein